MGPRQAGRRGQIVDGDRLGIAGIDQILGPQQIAGRGTCGMPSSMACSRNRHSKQYVYMADELAGRPRITAR